MKSVCRMEHMTRPIVATLLLVSMMLLTSAAYALDCTKCHGSAGDARPLDTPAGLPASYRNLTTGAFKGNHRTHAAASATGNVCTRCHGDAAASYGNKHALTNNFTIQMNAAIKYNKYTSAAAFANHTSALTAFPQTSVPELGKCSTVDCHFQTRTPVWGSAPLDVPSTTTCSVCHSALPDTGSHSVHIAEHGGDLNACTICHSDHTVEAKPFQHATSAGRAITIHAFRGYSGNGSNNLYLPSQAADRTLGYCATASCHDDGLGNGAQSLVDTPVWGSSVLKCNVCHMRQPTTGSHVPHVASAGIGCAACHKGAAEGQTVPVAHTNGVVDVYANTPGDLGYPADKAKGSPYTTCSTASCHVNPSAAGAQMASPTWGDGSQAKCSYCHASRPATGSHQAHFNAGFTVCGNCHSGAVDGVAVSASHSNGVVDVYKVTQGDFGYPSPKAIGSAPGKCSTGSCHDDGRGNAVSSPTWGTSVPNCTACHAALPGTGSHTQHVTNQGISCGNCHKGAVQGSTVPALHMNGYVDVYRSAEGDLGYPARKAKGSGFSSCNASSCHGNSPMQWGANTGNYQCTKCHGQGVAQANYSSNNRQSAPGYGGVGLGIQHQASIITNNVSSDPKIGAHDTHMRSLNNLGMPVSCSDCHVVPATAFSAGHMNGSSLPTWSNLAQNKETIEGSAIPYSYGKGTLISAYDPATGTCSNIYCHGGSMTDGVSTQPKWNETGYVTGDRSHDCQQCHGYPPTSASSRRPHNPATEMDCSSCHPHNGYRDATGATTDTGQSVGYDFHINGNLEAMKYCNACHDYDTRGANGTLWGKNQMAVEGFGAHAVHINYLKKRMNITSMNANEDTYGTANFNGICGACHSRDQLDHHQGDRAHPRKINFGDDANRAARQFGSSLPQYNGVTGVSSSVTLKTCSNVDCHYKTSPIWQPY
jgi:predicted CxxxxCH...CXXCH cytochrome family protein